MNGKEYEENLRLIEEIKRLRKIIDAYEEFEGDVAHAMHKVGWNNSRIESAYDELQDVLKETEG
ncbi:hypothetical protein PQE75_gp028 [Bacillus phage vB_BcoS-136]|uniref:Uncharacterized protein n=1 Tax=Bacillus phage vB_BcoS-136 TaxID=2419619 RepID=A0A3G3BVJ5_9CAUD|nr:hypothetical protein PQE75_gp028 [Bacillus phage vB_BcoS-136]AYP68160.1 hypothetical protein vBBcoS136_00028 [Bacillus phage vB_BcoS-136]